MKVTGFNPIINTSNAEETMKVFEALGFEKTHAPKLETEDHTVTITE